MNNDEAIGGMLNKFGETTVSEVRIFSIDSGMVLYIRCNSNEYLTVVDEKSYLLNFDGIQPFVIYKADDFMEAKEQYLESLNPKKSTYEVEATALQEEGLLYGNENGLDLLKPMTRIEAVTMILRAIGNDDTATRCV